MKSGVQFAEENNLIKEIDEQSAEASSKRMTIKRVEDIESYGARIGGKLFDEASFFKPDSAQKYVRDYSKRRKFQQQEQSHTPKLQPSPLRQQLTKRVAPIQPIEETEVILPDRPETATSLTSEQEKIKERKRSIPNYASRSLLGTNNDYKDAVARKQFEVLQKDPKYMQAQQQKKAAKTSLISINSLKTNPIVTSRKQQDILYKMKRQLEELEAKEGGVDKDQDNSTLQKQMALQSGADYEEPLDNQALSKMLAKIKQRSQTTMELTHGMSETRNSGFLSPNILIKDTTRNPVPSSLRVNRHSVKQDSKFSNNKASTSKSVVHFSNPDESIICGEGRVQGGSRIPFTNETAAFLGADLNIATKDISFGENTLQRHNQWQAQRVYIRKHINGVLDFRRKFIGVNQSHLKQSVMDQTESHRWRVEQQQSNTYVPLPLRQKEYFSQLRHTKKKLKKVDEKELEEQQLIEKEAKKEQKKNPDGHHLGGQQSPQGNNNPQHQLSKVDSMAHVSEFQQSIDSDHSPMRGSDGMRGSQSSIGMGQGSTSGMRSTKKKSLKRMPYDDSLPDKEHIRIPAVLNKHVRPTYETNMQMKMDRTNAGGARNNSLASLNMLTNNSQFGATQQSDDEWQPDLEDLVVIGQEVLSKEIAFAKSIPEQDRVMVYKSEVEQY